MSVVPADVARRVKLSDPRPDRCSACYQGADASSRFVNMDAASDRGSLVTDDGFTVVGSVDDIHLCEACVREAAEELAVKPESMRRFLRERDEARQVADYWKTYARDLEEALHKRPIEVQTRRRRSS